MEFLIYQKKPWKHTYKKKYSNPQADTPMGGFTELNRMQPLEETFDNSPIKLGEVKDFGNSYESCILKNSLQRIGD